MEPVHTLSAAEGYARARAAFQAGVAGCMLGKPLEIDATLAEIRTAAESIGEWPLDDYVSEALLDAIGRRHPDAHATTRGNLTCVYVSPLVQAV